MCVCISYLSVLLASRYVYYTYCISILFSIFQRTGKSLIVTKCFLCFFKRVLLCWFHWFVWHESYVIFQPIRAVTRFPILIVMTSRLLPQGQPAYCIGYWRSVYQPSLSKVTHSGQLHSRFSIHHACSTSNTIRHQKIYSVPPWNSLKQHAKNGKLYLFRARKQVCHDVTVLETRWRCECRATPFYHCA